MRFFDRKRSFGFFAVLGSFGLLLDAQAGTVFVDVPHLKASSTAAGLSPLQRAAAREFMATSQAGIAAIPGTVITTGTRSKKGGCDLPSMVVTPDPGEVVVLKTDRDCRVIVGDPADSPNQAPIEAPKANVANAEDDLALPATIFPHLWHLYSMRNTSFYADDYGLVLSSTRVSKSYKVIRPGDHPGYPSGVFYDRGGPAGGWALANNLPGFDYGWFYTLGENSGGNWNFPAPTLEAFYEADYSWDLYSPIFNEWTTLYYYDYTNVYASPSYGSFGGSCYYSGFQDSPVNYGIGSYNCGPPHEWLVDTGPFNLCDPIP